MELWRQFRSERGRAGRNEGRTDGRRGGGWRVILNQKSVDGMRVICLEKEEEEEEEEEEREEAEEEPSVNGIMAGGGRLS